MSAEVRWDQSKFDTTLERYVKNSRRTMPEICNTKGFFIARAAIYHTHKASRDRIQADLGRLITTQRTTKSGRVVNSRSVEFTAGSYAPAPLAGLIVNKRRRLAGHDILVGREMEKAALGLINSRLRSVAFIRSGWLPGVRILAKFAKNKSAAAAQDSAVRQVGADKGHATPAFEGHTTRAIIENHAVAKHDKKNALQKYGDRGLQLAFDQETKDMVAYMEKEMKPDADEANRGFA